MTDTITRTAPAAGRLPLAGIALCVMVAMEFSGGFEALAAYSPVSPFVACLAAAGLIAGYQLIRGTGTILWLPLLAIIGYLVAVVISALASSLPPTVTAAGVNDTLKLVIYVSIIALLIVERPSATADRPARWQRNWLAVALAVTVPMAAISLLGVVNEFILSDQQTFFGFERVTDYLGVGSATARHAGPLEDPNFWGRFLATGLPLSLALVQRSWATGRRFWAAAAAGSTVLLLAGIYLTSSRGTFVAATIAVGCYLVAAGVSVLRCALIAAAGGLLLLIPGVGSRLFSFGGQDVQLAAEDQSVVSRIATQRVAVAMIHDRPLFGVGPDGYFTAFGHYAAQAQQSLDRVLAPHNLYLGLWAQTGILGLIGFLIILAVGVVAATKTCLATRRLTIADQRRFRPYAAGLLAGLIGWCVASAFLHLSYARIPLIMVCLAAGLWRQLRAMPAVHTAPVPVRTLRTVGSAMAAALAAVIVMISIPHGTTATLSGRVVPNDPDDSYLINLRTRTGVIPSLAVAIGQVAPQPVDAQGDVRAGQVTITANAAAPDAARSRITAAVTAGDAALRKAGMVGVFHIVWNDRTTTSRTDPDSTQIVAAAGIGCVLGAGGQLLIARLLSVRAGKHPRQRR